MTVRSLRATVLRTLPYGDTSLIIRFGTAEMGVLTVMARGLRKGRKGSAPPQLFSSGSLTADVREHRDMHPLRDFAADRVRLGLSASLTRLAGASLLGDLVLRHTGGEAQEEVALRLEHGLDAVERAPDDQVGDCVLSGAWGIVASLGYRPHLESCVACGRNFEPDEVGRFDHARGGVACSGCQSAGPRVGPIARSEMTGLIDGPLHDSAGTESVSKVVPHLKVLADFASYHVAHGKRVTAFDYFIDTLTTEGASSV